MRAREGHTSPLLRRLSGVDLPIYLRKRCITANSRRHRKRQPRAASASSTSVDKQPTRLNLLHSGLSDSIPFPIEMRVCAIMY